MAYGVIDTTTMLRETTHLEAVVNQPRAGVQSGRLIVVHREGVIIAD